MKNKTWIWVSLGISVVGVGGYFLYKVIKQRSDLKKFANQDTTVVVQQQSSSSGSSSGGSSTGSNPFGSKEELKNFQSIDPFHRRYYLQGLL